MDNMQLWLSSSTDSINLNDSAEGFYLNPDLEGLTGLPEIRSVNGLNAGYDGGWTATQLWAARLITIRGVIAINDKAAVETKRKALAKLLAQGKNEDLELRFVSEAGNTYTTTVRTTNCTMALRRVFWRQEYQIQLRANDPLIYDDGGSELVAILRVMAGEGGFEIPFDIPFTIGGSIDPTSVDVGDEATYPLIRLKGDLHNPTIINMTTNQRMQVLADIITTIEWHDYTTTYTTDGYKQIGDGLDGAPLSLTHLYGNATQETLSGKNYASGAQYINTNSAQFEIGAGLVIPKTFTASAIIDKSVSNAGVVLYLDGTASGVLAHIDITANARTTVSCTIPDATYSTITSSTHVQVRFYQTGSGYDTSHTIGEPMIESGSIATAYEPYTGGSPMPNPQFPSPVETVTGLQTVKITGKNLAKLDNKTVTSNGLTYTFSSDGTISVSGTSTAISSVNATADFPTGLVAGQIYTLSLNNPIVNTDVTLRFARSVGGVLAGTTAAQVNRTFTFTAINTESVTLQVRISSGVTLDGFILKPQLELGSTATAYEPYQGQSYTIDLGSLELSKIGTYQDYIWNDDGTWKIHKETGRATVSLGTTVYTITGGLKGAIYSPSGKDNPGGASFCDKASRYSGNGAPYWDGCYYENPVNFMFVGGATDDTAALKAKYDGATLYYQLATPTDTEITDSELIEQLNHVYSLYQGTNNLWLVPSAGAQGEMVVSYATTEDIDYHEVVIDCQARTVTQDGRNLYPALAEGSEFIRLLPGENKLYLTSEVESDNGTAEVKFKKGNISI